MYPAPNGNVLPCCVADHGKPVGNLKQNSLEEIWDSPGIKQLRQDMLDDKPNAMCSMCDSIDAKGGTSKRQISNTVFKQHIPIATEVDTKFNMRFWDVRFSNLCNLRCRTCSQDFSTSWYQDAKKMNRIPVWQESPLLYPGKHEHDLFEQMMQNIQHIDGINFAGGEPLMMAEHYAVLDELLKAGKTDTRIVYNTNLSSLTFKDKNVLDYWEKFTNIRISISIDGSGARGELIRKNLVWDELVENFQQVKARVPHADINVTATLGAMNSYHIVDFHKELVAMRLIEPRDFYIILLHQPAHLRLNVLPKAMNEELQALYGEHLEWLKTQTDTNVVMSGFTGALNMLKSGHSLGINTFLAYTRELDEIRGESFFAVFPELQNIKGL